MQVIIFLQVEDYQGFLIFFKWRAVFLNFLK